VREVECVHARVYGVVLDGASLLESERESSRACEQIDSHRSPSFTLLLDGGSDYRSMFDGSSLPGSTMVSK
jgi:hypothetical protein